MTTQKQPSSFTYFGQHCCEQAYDLTNHIKRKFLQLIEKHFISHYFKNLDYFSIMYLFDDEDAGYIYTAKFDKNQISPAKKSVFTDDNTQYIGLDLLFTEEEWSDKEVFSKTLPYKTRLAFGKMLDLAEKEGELLDRQAAITDFEEAVTEYEAVLPELLKA